MNKNMFQNKNLKSLETNLLFKDVDQSIISSIFDSKNFRAEKEGELIFQAGDESKWLYLVLEGQIKLKFYGTMGGNSPFKKGKNEFLGEREILDGTTRISSAVVDTDCILYLISKETLLDLASKHKIILRNLSFDLSENGFVDENKVNPDQEKLTGQNEISEEELVQHFENEQIPGEKVIIENETNNIQLQTPETEVPANFDYGQDSKNETELFSVETDHEVEANHLEDTINNDLTTPESNKESKINLPGEELSDEGLLNGNDELNSTLDFENIPPAPQKFTFSPGSSLNQEKQFEELFPPETLSLVESAEVFLNSNLKFPVSQIKKYTTFLKRHLPDSESAKAADLIIKQTDILTNIVETTLGLLSGKSSLHLQTESVSKVIDNTLTLLSGYVESRNVKLYKKIDTEVNVDVDTWKLYNVFFQIAQNACDAMPNGGNIFVAVTKDEDYVKIEFLDEGLGVPSSISYEIFEPFITHGKEGAAGLGLSIARKIIQDHRGNISIDGELGEGTKIIINLPVKY